MLDEDVSETKDLMAVAHYLAQWFASPSYAKWHPSYPVSLREIEKGWGNPIPALQTKSVKWLMFRPIIDQTEQPLLFVANNSKYVGDDEFGGYNPPYLHTIGINLNLLAKRKRSVASTILHELDHALLDMKSNGKSVEAQPYKQASTDYSSYLQHPVEVNARFAQALWDIATRYETIAKGDVYSAIQQSLADNRINSKIVPDPKQYKRLVVRAYKFLDDVGQIVGDKIDKPGFVQKVKNLIRKWLPK